MRGAPELRLSLALNDLPLSQWQARKIRLSLSGDYALDTELYTLLRNDVTRMTITPVKGRAAVILPPGCLMPVGFGQDEALLPGFSHVFSGYQLLQDYFTFPSKFIYSSNLPA
jgi:type VI secretion system protein ImpG